MFSALHSCGHVSLWRTEGAAPKIRDRMTCERCGHAVSVVAVFGPWRCLCLDCGRVNHHGKVRRTVQAHAVRHVQEWATHRVRVWQYGDRDSVTVVTSATVGVQAPLVSDAPF